MTEKSPPKVTIGICVKNVEDLIEDAMKSVIIQDYPHENLEIIIVDGYSDDHTVSIIMKYITNADIEHILLYENQGLGTARNMVINNSTGDYIIWHDGDMTLARDHISKQINFMESNPKVGIAGGKFALYPGENYIATLEGIEWIVADHLHGKKASLKPVLHRAGGSVYRVEAIKQIGGFDANIKGALEDLDAEYRLGELGWSTYFITDAVFNDRRKQTFSAIWKENFWYGYGGHYFLHKYGKGLPTSTILIGIKRISVAYKLTRRKIVFFLIIQYVFKKIAWLFGFINAHREGYGHNFT